MNINLRVGERRKFNNDNKASLFDILESITSLATDKTSSITYPLVVVSDAGCHADLHHLWWVFFTVFCHDEMTIHTREIFYRSHEEHLTSS